MRLNFQHKLTLSFLLLFTLFTAGIVLFEQRGARKYKTEALQERLDAYADEVAAFVRTNGDRAHLDSLLTLMPDNLRLTLIKRDGRVLFDNAFADPSRLENHAGRPEILDAVARGTGTFIRTSASNSRPYLYYAKDLGNATIVRVALPYDIEVRSFLKPDNAFLYFVIALFVLGLASVYSIGRRFGRTVKNLHELSRALNEKENSLGAIDLPHDEFGEIGRKLVEYFDTIRKSENRLAAEREKLLLHIQTSAEGVCFFTPDKRVAFYNGLFLQYFNTLYDSSLATGENLFAAGTFTETAAFLDDPSSDNYYETHLHRHGREFSLQLNIFDDRSFEIILTDITAQEKTRRLKQEMTGNIAHELRTPLTSIRGFLEILLNNELDANKAREYLERAYNQTKTLSELISDMSLLTRIEERREPVGREPVDVNRVLEQVYRDTAPMLTEKNITFNADIPQGSCVQGNKNLIYSIFRNLTDNVIRHAGENIAIIVRAIEVRDGMIYFSFADTGRGVENEQHLNRLFERFYRVDEGRTRDTGGSGLGLAIVKNAVSFLGGQITVHNRTKGGLVFTIGLPRYKD